MKTIIQIILIIVLNLSLKAQIELNSAFKYLNAGNLEESIREFEKYIKKDYLLPKGSIILDSILKCYYENPNKHEVNYVLGVLCKKMNFIYDSGLFLENVIKLTSKKKYIRKSCKLLKEMKFSEEEINYCRFIKEYLNVLRTRIEDCLIKNPSDSGNVIKSDITVFKYNRFYLEKDNLHFRNYKNKYSTEKRNRNEKLFAFWDEETRWRFGEDYDKYFIKYKNYNFDKFMPIVGFALKEGVAKVDVGEFSYLVIKKGSVLKISYPGNEIVRENSNSLVKYK